MEINSPACWVSKYLFLPNGPNFHPEALWELSVGTCGDCRTLAVWTGSEGSVKELLKGSYQRPRLSS